MPEPIRPDRAVMDYDVVIVGAGPAGLSCAIRLKQLDSARSVCILEKGSEVGAHLLSGAVFEPRALDELFPDWRERGAPLKVQPVEDRFVFLTCAAAVALPTPPQMHNHGNYIISLGELGRWLAREAEALGVEIYPGFAASELLYDSAGAVMGVATGDMGLDHEGKPGPQFQPGMELHAKRTVLAEGCHGSLTKQAIARFDLRAGKSPQTYGLGIKEVWEIDPARHKQGLCLHTIGWPMDAQSYGGSWMYHMADNLVSVGFVVGLDYKNPHLSPFSEMQRYKTHPAIRPYLEGGKRIAYGARALVEGGLQSMPKLEFPGGMLAGDSAGFLNVPKIKGNHAAMKSGMLAAEAMHAGADYEGLFRKSWLYDELYRVRNIRPGFHFGLLFGLLHAAFQTIGGWRLPYTLKNRADHAATGLAADYPRIDYPKPDGVLTFDRLTSVFLSNTNHEEGQPCHLRLRDPAVPVAVNLPRYDEPAQRYCPAGVYEIVDGAEGQGPRLQINAQNCVHCKTCDIKDPSQNIDWTTPQGGGGPNYGAM